MPTRPHPPRQPQRPTAAAYLFQLRRRQVAPHRALHLYRNAARPALVVRDRDLDEPRDRRALRRRHHNFGPRCGRELEKVVRRSTRGEEDVHGDLARGVCACGRGASDVYFALLAREEARART